MDVDARIQLFDFKTKYQFETTPGIDQYNMPLYSVQVESPSQIPQNIASFPVYQGFMGPCYVNGIQVPFYTRHDNFWNLWPNYIQPLNQVGIGDGNKTAFTFSLPFFPAIPGHMDINGVISNSAGIGAVNDPVFVTAFPADALAPNDILLPTTSFYPGVFITYTNEDGSIRTVTDSGVFLAGNTGAQLYGLLMQVGNPPFGNQALSDGLGNANQYSTTLNTVNYATGVVNVNFRSAPAAGTNIQVQCYFYEQGIPRAILFYNNCLTVRPPPNVPYLVELDAYLTPAAFLSAESAFPFGYMTEYIARGAARKILSDTGDVDQFMFYEPLFKEQETLVWKRSQRQFTTSRTGTIFSESQGQTNYNNIGAGTN